MPYFICPNCRERSIDHDRQEGLTRQAVACHRCGFGFLFELLDDYYPAPSTGFIVCDQQSRILASGRGVFELTGYREDELMGREVMDSLVLTGYEDGRNPAQLALEWGVRRLGERLWTTCQRDHRVDSRSVQAACAWRARGTLRASSGISVR